MTGPSVVAAAPDPATGRRPDLVRSERAAKTYGTGLTAVVAVHDLTCRVTPDARIAVTGRSGSGKSTLLHLMAGLDTPTAGAVSWPGLGGHPLARPGRVGMVFQGPSLLPALTALENVAFPLLLADLPAGAATARARDALHRLELSALADALPQELSGGQAQRVAVARALASRPTLILADEPTGQLDHCAADRVITVLLQAADDLSAALLITTHDHRIAARLPTRWTMQDGRLLTAPAAPTTGRR